MANVMDIKPCMSCTVLAQILDNVGTASRDQLIEHIVQNIHKDEIEDGRKELFAIALQSYKEQLAARDIYQVPDLTLKKRRGTGSSKEDDAAVKCAGDVMDLTIHVKGLKPHFPKDILAPHGGRFIDLQSA